MGYRKATAYIETEVDVSLDDFDLNDVIEYVEDNNYIVLPDKGLTCGIQNLDDRIWRLYQTWKLPSNEKDFWNEMHSFFSDYYNKVSA